MGWRKSLLAAVLCLTAGPALAEWRAEVTSYGGVRFASATDPGGTLTIRCAAPDPEATAVGQAGTPFNATVELSGRLFAPGDDVDRMTATLVPGATAYLFATSTFDAQRDLWPMPLAMADPAMLAALSAESLVLHNGRGQGWRYATDGLRAALSATFAACVEGWRAKGHRVPLALAAFAPAAPSAAIGTGPLPPTIAQRIVRICNGPFQLNPDDLLTGLIDGDTVPDYVLNWNTVRCTTGLARPLCGAANCSIDAYLSSRGYRHSERDSLLGIAPSLVPLSNGRMGIKISGTAGACSTGFCDRPFWWDGTRLRQ